MHEKLSGNENITFGGSPIGQTIRDFWSWSSSDLLNNTLRGSYCEFLVSSAVGADMTYANEDWTPFDILMKDETIGDIKIEVKSAAYLQAWDSGRLSSIRFSIHPSLAWCAETGYENSSRRQSDVYVFCLYAETDRTKSDPLNLDKWEFYILPTKTLDENCREQKTISLSSLLKFNPCKTDYTGIRDAIVNAVKK